MEDALLLPVTYKGENLAFPVKVIPQGYAPKFLILINQVEVIYERDDAGEFRALIASPEANHGPLPETGLLAAIGAVIQAISE